MVETDAATATPTTTTAVGVEYRGHVQDYGDYPTDGTWVQGDGQLGTTAQSKRIEGFNIELTGGTAIPAGASIRYNVHIENEDWQNDPNNLTDTSNWKANGAFAGSRAKSQRVEAIEIVLVGADGKTLPGYSVQYLVHGENYGWTHGWKADGAIAGTTHQCLRLEAIEIKIVKDAPTAYNTAGTYGPQTGTEVVNHDVTVGADGVTLQNLHIKGDLIIAKEVGSGTVNLNNVTVDGNTYVRGGGPNSIHINGGSYNNIIVEKTASGNVRIVATDATGLTVVISEETQGQDIILEGTFDTVKIQAPDVKVSTQGNTAIKELNIAAGAKDAEITLDSKTTVQKAVLDAAVDMKGTGTINQADVNANNVTFEQKPVKQTVEPDVTVPPVVIPVTPVTPPGGGGSPSVAVSGITVTGTGSATTITTDNGTLQMLAAVLPTTATDKSVTWTVTVKATSVSTGSVNGTLVVTLSNQVATTPAAAFGTPTALNNTVSLTGLVAGTTYEWIIGNPAVWTAPNTFTLGAGVTTKDLTDTGFVNGAKLNIRVKANAGAAVSAVQVLTVATANIGMDADQVAVNAEALKYETAATIAKTVAVDEDVDATVVKLKSGQTADGTITIGREPADGTYLKVASNVYVLKAQKTTAGDGTENAVLTFTKNGKTATATVAVTVTAQ
ncbi:hypothetical protein [Acetobacterium tundrae]|uniref:hypothetical protein n=1 Tax=Acetobacterium tundrae TaxID=132932 RepID=UPI003B75CDCC